MNVFTKIVLALIIIGAINWGLVGFFDWNLVNAIFGGATSSGPSALSRVIYALVGLAGLAMIALWPRVREVSATREPARQRAPVRP